MRKFWKAFVIILILGIGAGLYLYGQSFPVYTDMNGPNELARVLDDAPEESRTQKWYEELAKIETPHKRCTDLGRGLMALAVGLGLAWRLTWKYERKRPDEKWAYLRLVWFGLWLLRMPLIVTYYVLRANRHDYPWWADTIAIPIFSGWISMIVGHEVSGLILRRGLRGNVLPGRIPWRFPPGSWRSTRFALVALWLVVLLGLVFEGVMDGDEGLVIACTGAVPVLLAFQGARPECGEMAGEAEVDGVTVAEG
jgi:hypothetical protein